MQALKGKNIVPSVHWKPLHMHTFYQKQGFINESFPNATKVFEQIITLPNVKIYGFYNCTFVNNLANYYNSSHYQPDVNRYMLYAIKHDLHRITVENIEKYEQQMLKNLRNFKIQENYPHMDSLEDLIQQNTSRSKL